MSTDPRDKRLRTSALVEVDGKVIVIDAGPDFRYQMLHHHVMTMDALLITHGIGIMWRASMIYAPSTISRARS